ncbi:MAG: IclR family transcriptional regulator [Solirubrobacterales bacterium]|nr:IclR family transcriptional regulator [Solirubrobacterales bacterium]HMT05570.1 IclR family transcriptional regulator [Solirubrobacterales bacterium]
MAARPEGKYQVPAVVGAISVLNELASSGEAGATQSELVQATELSKSTLHNLLSTLEVHGFVRRDTNSRQYRLGPALIPLGNEATLQVKLVRSTLDLVAPLAGEYGLSFAVAQPIGPDEMRIISRFYPPGVHVGITVGSAYGPMDGALGKILLASRDASEATKLIKGRKLPAHTRATITSPDSLIEEIDEVRSRGWSVSHGELNENNAVASGILGADGELELVLLALGFPAQLDGERLDEIGAVLRGTAEAVMASAGIAAPDR